MTIGERIEERRKALGIKSQAELARQADVRQSTLNGLIRNPYRWSPYLPRLARTLRTTVEYLAGEIDDPDEGAPPPTPAPRHQLVTMQVLLPSEAALTRMFRGFLKSLEGVEEVDLAHELATLLPSGLGQLRGPLREEEMDRPDTRPEAAEDAPNADREQQRAQRT